MPLISWLLFILKSTLLCLIYDIGDGPCKHISFSGNTMLSVVSRWLERRVQETRGFAPVCFSLLAPGVHNNQQCMRRPVCSLPTSEVCWMAFPMDNFLWHFGGQPLSKFHEVILPYGQFSKHPENGFWQFGCYVPQRTSQSNGLWPYPSPLHWRGWVPLPELFICALLLRLRGNGFSCTCFCIIL